METENLAQRVEKAISILVGAQSVIRLGALASDSCIMDEELQLKGSEDYYLLLKEVNLKINNAIKTLNF